MVEAVVVDDSHFMRVQITELLEDGGITVVGDARNGKEAIEAVERHAPDVVTMDVKMPGMDGISAVENIMARNPTPILMLSRYTEEGAETTLEALEAGAVDFFRKPDGEVSTSLVQYAEDLVEAVSVVASADVSRSAKTASDAVDDTDAVDAVDSISLRAPATVVIAASTGGPPEVQEILSQLPGELDARVLVVQHMPENFTGRFAERLNTMCELDVREAGDGELVKPGEAVVARGGQHLEIADDDGTSLTVALTDDERVHSVRPAADVTFQSAATVCTTPLVGVVLSGMGRDGAAGVRQLAEAGGTVIAQEPESASIASMPERAIKTGAVDEVLPVRKIDRAIIDALDK